MNDRVLDFRWPRNNIWLISILYILAGAYFLPYGETTTERLIGLVMLPIGIGLWLKFQWARWMAIGFILVTLMLMAFVTIMKGLTWKSALRALMQVSFLHSLWEWKVYPDP